MSVSHPAVVDPLPVLPRLAVVLAGVVDPRDRRGVRHEVFTVVAVAALAVLGGAMSFRAISDYAMDLSQESLGRVRAWWCPRRQRRVPPSEATLRRVVQQLDAAVFDDIINAVLRSTATPAGVDASGTLVGVAIDGKTARGGWVGDEQVRLFAAMRHDGVVLAQVRVPEHTTEVTQVDTLLCGIDLSGMVVTADAAHAHPRFGPGIRERGGDFVVTVKTNRPKLITAILADLRAADTIRCVDDEHTRGVIRRRAIRIAPARHTRYPGAGQVFQIVRETFTLCGQRRSKEIVHGVTSLTTHQAGPAHVAGLVRAHWGIENKLHWIRDVVFGEDHHQTYRGNGTQILATLRNLAISTIRLAGLGPIKRTLEHLNRNQTKALALLGL